MLMKNENALHIQGMQSCQQQLRNVNNDRWALAAWWTQKPRLNPNPSSSSRGDTSPSRTSPCSNFTRPMRRWANSDNSRVRLAVAANLGTS
jgi:hypothetical protein